MPFLEVIQGERLGDRIELSLGRYLIGRHPSCQIVVDASAVSRQHAQILRDNDNFMIEDLDSRNGTYVNDDLIVGKHRLSNQDVVRVCEVIFRFCDGLIEQTDPVRSTIDGNDNSNGSSRSSSGRSLAQFVDGEDDELPQFTSQLEIDKADTAHSQSITIEQKLNTLIEITRKLSQTLVLDEVLPKVLESLFSIFPQADRGFIVLEDRVSGELIPHWTLNRDPKDNFRQFNISRTIVNHVMKLQQAVVSKDASLDDRFDLSQSIINFPIRSVMCAPIVNSEGKSIGTIQIDTLTQNENSHFNQADLEVLLTIAMQAASAIERAQLHESELLQRELTRDLELANDVQHAILPRSRPELDEFEFYDYYRPAQQVGGDYYDYVQLGDNRLGILVADVVGHGMSAAMVMAKFSAEARFALASQPTLKDAVTSLNQVMSALDFGRFVTLVMGILDTETGEMQFVNGGHQPPVIRRTNGTIEEPDLEFSGLPIGILESAEYPQFNCKIEKGDLVFLFTDGITECINSKQQMYGLERFKHLVNTQHEAPVCIGKRIISDIESYTGTEPFQDDLCLVCFGRTNQE